ncbi:sensor histidine kinase [Mangrovibrevibacter kandeliae]|uniref:sensor histidine kinase n=1 Tax=Mangrovibrevibacter kandeliae TaxID=2968473 RepID=UPI00211901C5|nr:HAMP domain-containing sensor histidine kinase [Aurantimonas sp. CSK15Z-1]MCQ8781064.1 HAMP domain-containing histidine kinase [Aurantimonas sp. CSK15Z-1]
MTSGHNTRMEPSDSRAVAALTYGLSRCEALVSPCVEDEGERWQQAGAVGVFLLSGLAAALACPLVAMTAGGLPAGASLAVVAGLFFVAAAALAASGRLETVVGFTMACATALVAGLAMIDGGIASPLLFLLAIGPLQASIAGRRRRALTAAAGACLALAGVAAASLAGFCAQVIDPGATAPIAMALLIAYAALGGASVRRTAPAPARNEAPAADTSLSDLIAHALKPATLTLLPGGTDVLVSSEAGGHLSISAGRRRIEVLLERVHVTDRVVLLQTVDGVRSGTPRAHCEVRVRAGADAGQWRRVTLDFAAARGAAGVPAAIHAVLRESEVAQAELSQLQEALEQARSASESKSSFLATVSHELRTPLNAIIGFADLLDMEFFGGFESSQQKEYVGLIRQSGQHLLSVVNSLLDMSKIEAGRYELFLEPFRGAELITAAADMMRAEAEKKGLTLDVRAECGDATLVADRRACQQMLINLLANAIKFTETGIVTLESRVEADSFVFAVADTGIGIPQDAIGRLGRPFVQISSGLSRQYEGTGLGLSLVKGLSELHHGSMQITSEQGLGTMVAVRLPLNASTGGEDLRNPTENVVALTHARKTANASTHSSSTRRIA